jgi:hypothetical protein
MRKTSPVSVTRGERDLVELVVAFANQQPAPTSSAAVERHFRQHRWVRHSPYRRVRRSGRAHGAPRAEDPRDVQITLRRRLQNVIQRDDKQSAKKGASPSLPHHVERIRLEKTLRELLTVPVKTPSGTRRLPSGTAVVCFQRGELTLGFQPFLPGARAAITYGLALLFDTRRGLAEGLTQCHAVLEKKECGRFFWRASRTQRYCTPEHAEEVRRSKTRRRVQTWRGKHEGWYEQERDRRQRKALKRTRATKKKKR